MSMLTAEPTIETLLESGEWESASQLIQQELAVHPGDHWLITQLGVTFYEQQQYLQSLRHFLTSLEIVPDCPLTLWNLAGALDALEKSADAVSIYTWLLKSRKTVDDDSCWESRDWTESLKTDCVYRLGVCFQRMGQSGSAEHCFRQYINLLLAGMNGTWSVEDAKQHILKLEGKGKQRLAKEIREAFDATLQDVAVRGSLDGRKLPKLSFPDLLTM